MSLDGSIRICEICGLCAQDAFALRAWQSN
jgi:hypothetical protein